MLTALPARRAAPRHAPQQGEHLAGVAACIHCAPGGGRSRPHLAAAELVGTRAAGAQPHAAACLLDAALLPARWRVGASYLRFSAPWPTQLCPFHLRRLRRAPEFPPEPLFDKTQEAAPA